MIDDSHPQGPGVDQQPLHIQGEPPANLHIFKSQFYFTGGETAVKLGPLKP